MIRASWPRFGSSKGVSTIIGAIFFVLIVLLVFNVFLWTMTQNTLYNQAVEESHQMDQDRFSERVVATRGNFTVPQNDTVLVRVTISNQGPLHAEIIRMWVTWKDGDAKSYGHEELDVNLSPGDAVSRSISVIVPGVQSTGTFSGWLVTARGNLVSLEKEKRVVVAQVSQGIGSIQMDLYMLRYFEVKTAKGSYSLSGYPDGTIGFSVPWKQKPIAFGVRLTNLDPDGRDIELYSSSMLWVTFPTVQEQPRSAWGYIVNVQPDGTIALTYSNVTLPFGEPTWVYFASTTDMRSGFSTSQSKWGGSGAVNLLLLGRIGDQDYDYGQNIPFVSIYVT